MQTIARLGFGAVAGNLWHGGKTGLDDPGYAAWRSVCLLTDDRARQGIIMAERFVGGNAALEEMVNHDGIR